MPSIEIRNPVGNPTLLLESDGAGGYVLPTTAGIAKGGCLAEVKALIFNHAGGLTANPPTIDPPGIPRSALASDIMPPMPYCQMMDNSWLVRAVPKAFVGQNFLRVWGKFAAGGPWVFADATFTGATTAPPPFPGAAPPPPAAAAAVPAAAAGAGPFPPLPGSWKVEIETVNHLSLFPDQLRIQAGLVKLRKKEVVLDLASPPADPVWAAGDPAGGVAYWRLSLFAPATTMAELTLRIRVNGTVLTEAWTCATWSMTAGGTFHPGSGNGIFAFPLVVGVP